MSILHVLEQSRRIDIYLAWQIIADGRKQIRRYSPHAVPDELKLFEPQSDKAIKWLESNDNPIWPCVAHGDAYTTVYIGVKTCGKV